MPSLRQVVSAWQRAIMSDAQSQDKFIVRLPDGLRDRIRAAADVNGRSMNSEIVKTLEDKYPAPSVGVNDPAAKALIWLATRIRKRNPEAGSFRDKQALMYERIANEILAKFSESQDDDLTSELENLTKNLK